MKRVLIFGANGMAGHLVYLWLKKAGYEVKGVVRSKYAVGSDYIANAMNESEVRRIILDGYDYVINCVGTLNRKVDEDLYHGIYINSVLPHFLARCCDETNSKLIHISSDCVFRGNQTNFYYEESEKDATSIYGVSKSLGEVDKDNHITLRTSLIGPEIREKGIGLFNWFMQNSEIDGFAKVYWTGITTLELSKTIERLINMGFKDGGYYHVVNNTKISKYALLRLINEKFCYGKVKIFYNDTIESDKSLYNSKKPEWVRVPKYEDMIVEMYDWMIGNRDIYNKYLVNRKET